MKMVHWLSSYKMKKVSGNLNYFYGYFQFDHTFVCTVAAHYGKNRENNRIVRQDTPCARKEQEEELRQALKLKEIQ